MTHIQRIALIALAPPREFDSIEEDPNDNWPGYGIRRIQADLVAHGWHQHADIRVFEARVDQTSQIDTAIRAFAPDLIGGSAYMWSFASLMDIAVNHKRRHPDSLVILGGPSARACMMQLAPYRDAAKYIDAICPGEGEGVLPDVLRQACHDRAALRAIPGLQVRSGDLWLDTAVRPLISDLDQVASPYQLGLMPTGQWGYLEAYRGCPMSCSFCQWGIDGPTNRIFSREYLAREMQAMEHSGVHPGIFHLDAGLNLNIRGFREFAAASQITGFFKRHMFFTHVYPSQLKTEHLDFLQDCAFPVVGLGLQAFDEQVLRQHSRPAKIKQFRQVVEQLAAIGRVEVQLILGLPGDSPRGFMQALEFALTLPASLRVFHALVLPDALMSRATPEMAIDFDPHTLKMKSCLGWSAEALNDTMRHLDQLAASGGGARSHLWWSLNCNRARQLAGH